MALEAPRGDPIAMRLGAAQLRVAADALSTAIEGVVNECEQLPYDGTAADRYRHRMIEHRARSRTLGARLHDLAGSLERSAIMLEDDIRHAAHAFGG